MGNAVWTGRCAVNTNVGLSAREVALEYENQELRAKLKRAELGVPNYDQSVLYHDTMAVRGCPPSIPMLRIARARIDSMTEFDGYRLLVYGGGAFNTTPHLALYVSNPELYSATDVCGLCAELGRRVINEYGVMIAKERKCAQ